MKQQYSPRIDRLILGFGCCGRASAIYPLGIQTWETLASDLIVFNLRDISPFYPFSSGAQLSSQITWKVGFSFDAIFSSNVELRLWLNSTLALRINGYEFPAGSTVVISTSQQNYESSVNSSSILQGLVPFGNQLLHVRIIFFGLGQTTVTVQPTLKSPSLQFWATHGESLPSANLDVTEFRFRQIISNVSLLHDFDLALLAFPSHTAMNPIPLQARLLQMYTDTATFTFYNETLKSLEAVLFDASDFSPLGSLVLNGLSLNVKYEITSAQVIFTASATGFMWKNDSWFQITIPYNNPSTLLSVIAAPLPVPPGMGPFSALSDDPR